MLVIGLKIGDFVWVTLPDGTKGRIIRLPPRPGHTDVRIGFDLPREVDIARKALCDSAGNLRDKEPSGAKP